MKIYNKLGVRRILFLVLVIVWMAQIFYMSSREAEESTEMSQPLGRVIAQYIVKDFDQMSPEQQIICSESIEYNIRKAAHMTEFGILGILLVGAFYPSRYVILLSFVIGSGYAVSDEIHQLFVPGRAGLVTDVFVDMAGLLLGIGVILAVIRIRNRRK